MLLRIEDIIVLHGSKEEDIVEEVEARFPRKKKVKEDVLCSFQTNVVDGLVVDLCSDTDL